MFLFVFRISYLEYFGIEYSLDSLILLFQKLKMLKSHPEVIVRLGYFVISEVKNYINEHPI